MWREFSRGAHACSAVPRVRGLSENSLDLSLCDSTLEGFNNSGSSFFITALRPYRGTITYAVPRGRVLRIENYPTFITATACLSFRNRWGKILVSVEHKHRYCETVENLWLSKKIKGTEQPWSALSKKQISTKTTTEFRKD